MEGAVVRAKDIFWQLYKVMYLVNLLSLNFLGTRPTLQLETRMLTHISSQRSYKPH